MKNLFFFILFYGALSACGNHKNLTQTKALPSNNNALIQHINGSKRDEKTINAQLKKLVQENDLVIAFASLNYAWVRRGTYCVLTNRKGEWKLFSYQAELLSSANETAQELSPLKLLQLSAENIKNLYAASDLWTTDGDADESFCSGKNDCNINDAETWTISVATPQNIHTTTYYAPKFFEDCCPGNTHRKRFVAISEEILKLAGTQNSAPDR